MKKKWICTALLGFLLLTGCSNQTGTQGGNETMPTETPTPTPFVAEYSPKDAPLLGAYRLMLLQVRLYRLVQP